MRAHLRYRYTHTYRYAFAHVPRSVQWIAFFRTSLRYTMSIQNLEPMAKIHHCQPGESIKSRSDDKTDKKETLPSTAKRATMSQHLSSHWPWNYSKLADGRKTRPEPGKLTVWSARYGPVKRGSGADKERWFRWVRSERHKEREKRVAVRMWRQWKELETCELSPCEK